jgi:hypothetical protein
MTAKAGTFNVYRRKRRKQRSIIKRKPFVVVVSFCKISTFHQSVVPALPATCPWLRRVGVVFDETQRADEYREEHRDDESDAPPQSHDIRRMILAAIDEGVFGQTHEGSLISGLVPHSPMNIAGLAPFNTVTDPTNDGK